MRIRGGFVCSRGSIFGCSGNWSFWLKSKNLTLTIKSEALPRVPVFEGFMFLTVLRNMAYFAQKWALNRFLAEKW